MSLPIRLAGLLAACVLTSCASLTGNTEPFAIYAPQLRTAAAAGPAVDWQLAIDTPLANSAIDSTRIAVMPTPGVLQIYPAARWRDPAPALLRGLIVEGFERSGRILGVGAAAGLRADFGLTLELRALQAEIGADGTRAVVRLQASLINYASNRVVAAHTFETAAPAAGSDMTAAFPAFETALDTIVVQLVDWTLAEGERRRNAGTR
ncbi:MAG TPA: ABC-type transport auxiliary lipoprotein family protein [Dokdonella sp.]|uniref:ABC-type transport auxiliary lipoprotein family protein n=1 Tax=Dokdonella sp. TaxID=2291710 RepID=UPI002C950D60|nr:ABC-type transport auxiliary lipoprotein family protein [Dokdonella sp.]HUD42667.1 ABC-type transport auxiliary lipoprotein family protein [Dokdonella sp.]